MQRKIAAASIVLLVLGACTQEEPAGPTAAPSEQARIADSGHSISGPFADHLGVAALVEVDQPRQDIRLALEFFVGDERVARGEDVLPYCDPDAKCWWAQSYTGGSLGPEESEIDRVEIVVSSAGRVRPDVPEIVELEINDEDEVLPTGKEGTVYVVAFDQGAAVYGYSTGVGGVRTTAKDPFDVGVEALDAGSVRAYFYEGETSGAVEGPVD